MFNLRISATLLVSTIGLSAAELVQNASQCTPARRGLRIPQAKQFIGSASLEQYFYTPGYRTLFFTAICLGSEVSALPRAQYKGTYSGLNDFNVRDVVKAGDCGTIDDTFCCMVDPTGPTVDDERSCDDSTRAICSLVSDSETPGILTCDNSGVLYLKVDGSFYLEDASGYLYFPAKGTVATAQEGSIYLEPAESGIAASVYVVKDTQALVNTADVCKCYPSSDPSFPEVMNECLGVVEQNICSEEHTIDPTPGQVCLVPADWASILDHLSQMQEILASYGIPLTNNTDDSPVGSLAGGG
jgi:hypothetical protein